MSLLDDIAVADQSDLTALKHMVTWATAECGCFSGSHERNARYRSNVFVVSRPSLAYFLKILQFQQWQGQDTLVVAGTPGHEQTIDAEVQLRLTPKSGDGSIQSGALLRIVDLALEKSEFARCLQAPISHDDLDAKQFALSHTMLVDFLRSARFMSWSEPGWSQPECLTAMRNVLARPGLSDGQQAS